MLNLVHREAWNEGSLLTPESLAVYYSGLKNKIRECDPELHDMLMSTTYNAPIKVRVKITSKC